RLESQCRLCGWPHRFSVEGEPALLSRRRSKDRWRRHGAAVAPGGWHARRQATEAQVGQDGARRIRAVVLGGAVAEIEFGVDVEQDGRHLLTQQGLLPVLIEELL